METSDMPTVENIRHRNLLALIDRAGSVQAFANRIRRSHGQVSQLKNRTPLESGRQREVGPKIARIIEQAFGLPVGWMDVDHGKEPAPAQAGEFVEVPFYAHACIAAGHGALNHSEPPSTIRFRAESIRRRGLSPTACAAVYVRGDSMAPLLEDGDVIMVDTSVTRVQDGAVYAVRIDGQELVKRLHVRPGRLLVRSENPAFPDFEVEAAAGVDVIGRVVWRAGWI